MSVRLSANWTAEPSPAEEVCHIEKETLAILSDLRAMQQTLVRLLHSRLLEPISPIGRLVTHALLEVHFALSLLPLEGGADGPLDLRSEEFERFRPDVDD